jgi:hypothetical protein
MVDIVSHKYAILKFFGFVVWGNGEDAVIFIGSIAGSGGTLVPYF